MTSLSKYTMNAEQAAAVFNIDSSTIRRWCKERKIDCRAVGTGRRKVWLVNPDSLRDRAKSGRPRKNPRI